MDMLVRIEVRGITTHQPAKGIKLATNFRLDRASDPRLLDETFDDEPGKTLKDLLTKYGPEAVRLLDA